MALSDDDNGDNVIQVEFASGSRSRPSSASAPTSPSTDLDPISGLYTVTDVARLFGYKPGRLRYWDRTGLLRPSVRLEGKRYYSFQDLIGVRAAKGLLEEGVSLRQVRRTVDSLRSALPKLARPLTELRVVADGRSVVVSDESGSYDPTTGQAVLDFRVESLESEVVRMRHGDEDDRAAAYECYLDGCRLDETESTFDEAEAAYEKALSLDPTLANALTNLGNLAYRRDRFEEAERYYREALKIDTTQPEALYNIGFLHFERAEVDDAIDYFNQALRFDPAFGDAHFNLAMAYEERAQRDLARPHWERYLTLEPDSSWAGIAREHLKRKR